MKKTKGSPFLNNLKKKQARFPFSGTLELTYRCDLNCIHCYCKGSEKLSEELDTDTWKRLLDELYKEGCLFIVFTGGDPFVRKDFRQIYTYAKKRGFIVSVFTNAQRIGSKEIELFSKLPPYCIEITLNAVTKNCYEIITQKEGSFNRGIHNVMALAKAKIPIILKANCLKENIGEIAKVKKFAEKLLGRPSTTTYYFKYDIMIYPRLNQDKAPCAHRLSAEEFRRLYVQDKDICQEYENGIRHGLPELNRDRQFLYRCDSWMEHFFINPFGMLKFCQFSNKFSVNLREKAFREGFYSVFPKISMQKFKTNTKCLGCKLRSLCYQCPARAFLETGDEEAPVEYYCSLAKDTAMAINQVKSITG
jgi:radical SAM protein with 4Fe4S-binding SPASM domain